MKTTRNIDKFSWNQMFNDKNGQTSGYLFICFYLGIISGVGFMIALIMHNDAGTTASALLGGSVLGAYVGRRFSTTEPLNEAEPMPIEEGQPIADKKETTE